MSNKHFKTPPPNEAALTRTQRWERQNPQLTSKPYLRPAGERLPPRRTSYLRIPRNDAPKGA